jgi:hypothetical protein
MKRRNRHVDPAQPSYDPSSPTSAWSTPIQPTAYGYAASPAPPGQVQCLRLVPVATCEPAPFETTVDHDTTLVWSGTTNGPAMQCGDVVNDAFESLAGVALRIGADGLYSIRLATAVDNGWMYVTVTATATLPRRAAPVSRLTAGDAPWQN